MKPLILFFILIIQPATAQITVEQSDTPPIPGLAIPPDPQISDLEQTMDALRDQLQSNDQSARTLIPGDPTHQNPLSQGTLREDVKKIFNDLNPEKEKQALRDLKATYEKAIATADLSVIEPFLAEDFTAVMITADEVKDYAGIKAYWKKVTEFIGKDGTYTVSIAPDDTIFEGNIAIAKGTAKEHVVRNGKTMDLVSKWTAIARKEGKTWKIVRIQATIDPVSNPIVTALAKAKLWITGSIAAVAGLLIGWLLGKRKRRSMIRATGSLDC